MSSRHHLRATVSPELGALIHDVVSESPFIASESSFHRHSALLGLQYALDHDLIPDTKLRARVRTFLERSAVAIGEPLGNGNIGALNV